MKGLNQSLGPFIGSNVMAVINTGTDQMYLLWKRQSPVLFIDMNNAGGRNTDANDVGAEGLLVLFSNV